MAPLEQLRLIHRLEQRWRKHYDERVREQLERRVDSFLGNICVPIMYKWVKYTKKRHPEDKLNDLLQDILNDCVKADTLSDKIITIERCINAHHNTNFFPAIIKDIGESKRVPMTKYYDGDSNYENTDY